MEGIGKGHRVIAHEATGEVSGVEKKIPLLSFIMRTLCVRGGEILEKKIHPPAQKMSSSRLQREHCGILPRGRICLSRTAPLVLEKWADAASGLVCGLQKRRTSPGAGVTRKHWNAEWRNSNRW